jgi:hypothetical protein
MDVDLGNGDVEVNLGLRNVDVDVDRRTWI